MREKAYEKPPLTNRQLKIFKKHHRMDFILYELSMTKFNRQVAAFGHEKMKTEVKKLKDYASKCMKKPQDCLITNFTTIRNSPKRNKIMKLTQVRGEIIGKKINRDYGKFLVF